jgi:hypothetical protein
MSYQLVWDAVDKKCPENLLEIISAKIPDIVNGVSSYEVFRQADAWGRSESTGYKLLQKALYEAEPLIKERIMEIVRNIDALYISDFISDHINSVIENMAKKDNNNGNRN